MSHVTKDHYAEISVNTAKVQGRHRGTEQAGDLHQLFTGFILDPDWCSSPPALTALPVSRLDLGIAQILEIAISGNHFCTGFVQVS